MHRSLCWTICMQGCGNKDFCPFEEFKVNRMRPLHVSFLKDAPHIFKHRTQDTKDVFHCQLFQKKLCLLMLSARAGEDSQTTPEAWLQHDMQDQSPCGERGTCFVHHQGVQFLRWIVLAERVPRRERWKRQDRVVSHASNHLPPSPSGANLQLCLRASTSKEGTRLTDALTRGVFVRPSGNSKV